MNIKKFTFNGFQENMYILSDEQSNCVIIDPGCYDRHEENELAKYIADKKLNVLALLNTHAHIDHVMGNEFVLSQFKVPYYLHVDDIPVLKAASISAKIYGFEGYKPSPAPTVLLKGNEELQFGDIKLKVLHTPGHAPGHVVFYSESDKIVINGDVLFQGSFGRTDLPGGSMKILKQTILEVMFNLPDDTVVYTGHGSETTIGAEKRSNPIRNY
jgi:glyoxylase-like metal-dependent hydrolase (beta-lactamase superfamily II)